MRQEFIKYNLNILCIICEKTKKHTRKSNLLELT